MNRTNFACTNFQLVSIIVNAATSRYYFPDLPNLRDAFVQEIHPYFNTAVPYTDTNVAVLPITIPAADSVYATFCWNGTEVLKQINIGLMTTIISNNTYANYTGSIKLNNIRINFSESYLEYPPGLALPALPYAFCFGIYYLHQNELPPQNNRR